MNADVVRISSTDGTESVTKHKTGERMLRVERTIGTLQREMGFG